MSIHSLGAHLYYITFNGDFSINTWIYYLKQNDEAYEMFKEFKYFIKNQTGKKIKIFRYDNSGEYTLNEFIDFCKKEGIKKETIVPYSPKQNGVAERKNKFNVEVDHAMLHDKKLLKSFGEKQQMMCYMFKTRYLIKHLTTRPMKKCS